VSAVAAIAGRPVRYPVTSHRGFLECPEHGCLVLLDEAGRIRSSCPACIVEARKARRRLRARRLRELEVA